MEVWRANLETGFLTRYTSFNQAVAEEVDFRPAEEQWV